MAKWGTFDYKEFEKLTERLEKTTHQLGEQVMVEVLKEAAHLVLRKTKERTPVQSGELRRNWYVTEVKRQGILLYIEIYNPKEYASFVEFGHRQEVGRYVPALGKKLKVPWVEGKFMLTLSIQEVEELLPQIANKYTQKAIKDLLK